MRQSQELAKQAEVSPDLVVRLIELGAIEPKDGDEAYGSSESGRVRLLHAWEEAGLSPEDVMSLVDAGDLAIDWLDTPVIARAARLDVTFEQLCSEDEIPLTTVQALYEAIGFAPPEPTDHIRAGDRELVELVQTFFAAGVGKDRCFGCCVSMQTAFVASPRRKQSCTSPRSKSHCAGLDEARES